MPIIALKDIKPNPWRDFSLYPLDNNQIDKLKDSINDHGFFGGIKARRNNGVVELGFGHHRLEAAKLAGLKEIEIAVGNISDDDMVRLMCIENATQRGAVAAAVINEVAAATRRLAKLLLQCNNSAIAELCPDWSQKSIDIALGHLENGQGIGDPAITQYLRGARSKRQIVDAITSLKDTGLYTKIITKVEKEIEQEAKEAEKEAERDKTNKEKEEKSAKAKKATERSKKARTASEKHKRILDERCASIFANDHQFAAFKEAVTSDLGVRFIALNQQLPLAKQLFIDLGKAGKEKGRVGAPYIKQYIASVIKKAIAEQKQIDNEERERAERENRRSALESKVKDLLSHVGSATSAGVKICSMLKEDPQLVHIPIMGKLNTRLDALLDVVKQMQRELNKG